jgi:hypothetical protein
MKKLYPRPGHLSGITCSWMVMDYWNMSCAVSWSKDTVGQIKEDMHSDYNQMIKNCRKGQSHPQ